MTSRSTDAFERAASLTRLGEERFDLLVVGGGITGAGVALDAASRGLRTALVERDDFASGTSSKSSKLVHGGLRYLQQREFRLVYEALYERQRALENAPHLVRVLPFLVPILARGGVIDRRLARVLGTALWMYDLTGGLRIGKRHHRIPVDAALAHIPTLARDRLAGAYVYYDAHADDARLTLTIARTAAVHGAVIANYAPVRGIEKDDDRVVGARVEADGRELVVRARVVVNAAGVWADDVRALDEGTDPASIRPAKGIHITVPWSKVRNDIAAIVPVAGDRRSVFVVPWGDTTYIGTTDTDYDGPLDDPPCTPADVDYLLAAINGVTRRAAHRVRRDRARGPASGPSCARATAPAPPTCRGGTRCAPRRAAWSPSPAASSPPTGAWPPTRSTPRSRSSVSAAARRGRSTYACSAARDWHRRSPRWSRARTSTSPAASAPRPRRCSPSSPTIPTSAKPSYPACRTSAPRRATRSATRWHARSTTCSVGARGRGSWLATPRRPRPTTWPTCSRSTSAGRDDERDAQVAGYRAAIAAERRAMS